MKVAISERQLTKLIGMRKEIDEDPIDPTTFSATGTGAGASTNGQSAGPEGKGADDFPAYPEVDKAEDLVKRGVANPVDYTKKHYEDYPEANPVRGRANPIKGM